MNMSKRIIRIALVVVLILLVPLVAMQFTDEVVWDFADFVVAGILLFGASLTHELVARKARTTKHRALIGVVIAVVLLFIWMELAVGIVGTPWAGS